MGNYCTQSVQASYDRIAAAYARNYANELLRKPFDRELLSRFASMIKDAGDVCDMGCGPGHVARYLRDAGLAKISGLDLSPCMVEEARRLNPDIEFRVGDMLALPFEDRSLAGIAAFYAIVNIPRVLLPTVFHEMWRVLQPEGRLLLSFHMGNEVIRPDQFLGQPMSMDFFLFPTSVIAKHLESTGFTIDDLVERGPYGPEVEYQSQRAYILARKLKMLDWRLREKDGLRQNS